MSKKKNKVKKAYVVPKDNKGVLRETITITRGPLPSPEIIEKYEKICPGSADRIMREAEKQTEHRVDMESCVIKGNVKLEELGLIFAFILAFILFIGGILMIFFDKEIIGLILLVKVVAFFVWMFIYKKNNNEKELERKK